MPEERSLECTAEQSVEVPVPRQEQTVEVAQDIPQELVQSHTTEQMVVLEVTQPTPQGRSFDRIAEQIADVNVPQNEEQNVKGRESHFTRNWALPSVPKTWQNVRCPGPGGKWGPTQVCKNTVLSTRWKRRRQPCDSRVQCTTAKLQSNEMLSW